MFILIWKACKKKKTCHKSGKKTHLHNYTILAHPSSCCKTRRVRHGLEIQNLLFKILPAFVCFKCPIVSCDFWNMLQLKNHCFGKIISDFFPIVTMLCSATLPTEPERPLHRNDMRPYPRPSPDQPFPGLDLPRLYTFHTTPYHLSLTTRSVLHSEFL